VAFVHLSAKLGVAWLHSLESETEEHLSKTKFLIGSYNEKEYHNKQSGFLEKLKKESHKTSLLGVVFHHEDLASLACF